MTIGINASAAFKEPRTGVEEYTYQLINHLAMLEQSLQHRFILYCGNISDDYLYQIFPNLSSNFLIKKLKWPLPAWTQIRLASEMFLNQPDLLFVPVHVLPLIHPNNSVVTVHGLEYEYYPELYSKKNLAYLRFSTQYALKHANKIIAISNNTKQDLVKLYQADSNKIKVVHHGFDVKGQNFKKNNSNLNFPYVLFLSRIESKKNARGIVRAFDLLKEKYHLPHKLILAGAKGYGYKSIKKRIEYSPHKKDIIEKGYLDYQEKWNLLRGAEAFLFPSFYEGFGMPLLEAQSVGCPVITSDISSMPEVAGDGALFVNPNRIEEITEAIYKIIKDESHRKNLTKKGYQNIKRFSWQKCAQNTLEILTE